MSRAIMKKVINTDLVNLLLEKGHRLDHVERDLNYKTGAIKIYFFFEYSKEIEEEVDRFMLELKKSKK